MYLLLTIRLSPHGKREREEQELLSPVQRYHLSYMLMTNQQPLSDQWERERDSHHMIQDHQAQSHATPGTGEYEIQKRDQQQLQAASSSFLSTYSRAIISTAVQTIWFLNLVFESTKSLLGLYPANKSRAEFHP